MLDTKESADLGRNRSNLTLSFSANYDLSWVKDFARAANHRAGSDVGMDASLLGTKYRECVWPVVPADHMERPAGS